MQCIYRKVDKYDSMIGVQEEPLVWWRKNQIQFPFWSKICNAMLSFMATSVFRNCFRPQNLIANMCLKGFFAHTMGCLTGLRLVRHFSQKSYLLFIHANFHFITDHYGLLLIFNVIINWFNSKFSFFIFLAVFLSVIKKIKRIRKKITAATSIAMYKIQPPTVVRIFQNE